MCKDTYRVQRSSNTQLQCSWLELHVNIVGPISDDLPITMSISYFAGPYLMRNAECDANRQFPGSKTKNLVFKIRREATGKRAQSGDTFLSFILLNMEVSCCLRMFLRPSPVVCACRIIGTSGIQYAKLRPTR